jgi:hypothetical protein
MALSFCVPFLGSLPMDPNLLKSCEEGVSFVGSSSLSCPAIGALNEIVDKVIEGCTT